MAVPLFSSPRAQQSSSMDQKKQEAFMKLKAICVPLLPLARVPPSSTSTRQLLELLHKLKETLSSIPRTVFSPPLGNYVFFPLSSLLQPSTDGRPRSDTILEATMQVLEVLVKKWKVCDAGMDLRVLQELWIMNVLSLGGPLDPSKPTAGKGKGKEVEKTDEAKLALVQTLLAIMEEGELLSAEEEAEDSSDEDDFIDKTIDWTSEDPLGPKAKAENASKSKPETPLPSPPLPILFHTLTTLLDLAAVPTSLVQLQLSSLTALETLITLYLTPHPPSPTTSTPSSFSPPSGPSPLLATALPGTASTLSRIAISLPSTSQAPSTSQGRRQPSSVIVAALRVLSLLVVAIVGDTITVDLRRRSAAEALASSATLEELFENFSTQSSTSDEPLSTDVLAPPPPPPSAPPTGPTLPSPAWLTYTLSSLSSLITSLSLLASHDSPPVRAALVNFLSSLILSCGTSLGSLRTGPLEGLLVLAGDDWESVSEPAKTTLREAIAQTSTDGGEVAKLIGEIVRGKMTGLPGALRRKEDKSVVRAARVVRVALELLDSNTSAPLSGVEKWSWAVLAALEFEKVVGVGEGRQQGMSVAWITGGGSFDGSEQSLVDWPWLRMTNVGDEAMGKELEKLWMAVGKSAVEGGQEAEVVEQFLGVALGVRRTESVAVGALWVLDGVVRGFGDAEGKGRKKVLRGLVRGLLSLLEQLEEPKDEEQEPSSTSQEGTTDTSLAALEDSSSRIIEHKHGAALTPSLDKLKPVAAATTKRDEQESHRLLLTCLSLRLLATSASLLTTSFQTHLLQTLYHLLAHLSPSSHPLLRAYAQHALTLVAEATSYASPQNLVLSNVDYVVNSVSQRLSVARLDPTAPLVLVEMIRLVGQPIVPMVQDLVEDVFEALDDYHGYEEVTLGLWAVLDALTRVMAEDIDQGEDRPRKNDIAHRPDPNADWKAFTEWFATRHAPPPPAVEGVEDGEDDQPATNPQRPFESSIPEDSKSTEFPPDVEVTASRPQTVAAQILSKALYFLSHPSPFLRSRVLSLIASAVPLLATSSESTNRQKDLLPVIHRAWPYILNRLADPEPPVVLEAAYLIESLATHVGEFMSKRILEDVWPRFRTVLERQEQLDRQSAIAGKSPYTASHRLHKSILQTMYKVARDVPMKEEVVWDEAMLFRRFLGNKWDAELQRVAKMVYEELGKVNPDVVWLVLAGAVGQEGLSEWLRVDELQDSVNVRVVLEGL